MAWTAPRLRMWMRVGAGAVLCALLLGAASPSPIKVLNTLSAETSVRKLEALPYAEGTRQKADVYLPEHPDRAPVIVFLYGGNWVSGQRFNYAFVGYALAKRGFITVIPDYRLYPEVSYPTFLEDPASAVAWAIKNAAHYGGDPQRVFVMGHSAGAYDAAMLAMDKQWLGAHGLTPAALRGWIGLAGPYNFLPIQYASTQKVFHSAEPPPESQPVEHVSGGSPPALLIAARQDELVAADRNTGELARRLRAAGVPVREKYLDHVNHYTIMAAVGRPLQWLAPVTDDVADFVEHPPAPAAATPE